MAIRAGPRADHRLVAALAARRASTRPATARRPWSPTRTETHERYEEHPLGRRAPLIHACLSAIADEAGYLIVVSDADGMLLSIEGAAPCACARRPT